MKKLFSIVLMVLVAACMTGCSLHGGHGHGPANGGSGYALRGSIPASVFGGAANVKAALRAVDPKNLTMKLGEHTLAYDTTNSTAEVYMFVKEVSFDILEDMNGQKVEMKVLDGTTTKFSQLFTLPEDFATNEAAATEGNAAVVIKQNLEISIVSVVQAAAKKLTELIEEIKEEKIGEVVSKAVEGEVNVEELTATFTVNGSTELKDGGTITIGDTVFVTVSPAVFEGDDESKGFDSKYVTLSLTAKSEKGTEVIVSKYGDDETVRKYGVKIGTSAGKWYIETNKVTYTGKVTFTFNSLNVVTNDGKTYTWGSPKSFTVTIAK